MPAPLVAIVALTLVTVAFAIAVPTVGDEGELPRSLPELVVPAIPFTLETLGVIAPVRVRHRRRGPARVADDGEARRRHHRHPSRTTREAWGQGGATILSGAFGGMGCCAMIGQTMINVKVLGARTRISTFLAGVFLLILVVVFGDLVAIIPMAALVAVMVMVSVATFDWHSIRPSTLRRIPIGETAVMVVTVAVVVATHNLAIGVGVGMLTAMVVFARRVAHFAAVERLVAADGASVRYTVHGELFFASSNDLTTRFSYADDPASVVIDLSGSHVWDASTVAALDAVGTK